MENANIKKKMTEIAVSKLIAMPEAERPYYDPETYRKLRLNIRTQGFKKEYALSGLWNKGLGKYEIFKGTHRLRASMDEGLTSIWMWIVDITRKDAVLEAFIDNDTNAPMNPMQKYHTFKCMLDIVKKEHKKVGAGRNPTAYASVIEKECLRLGQIVSEATIKNHLRLGDLPKSIQDLIGHGKLRIYQTVLSFPLMGKIPDREYEEFLKTASKQFWKPSRMKFEVKERLKRLKGEKVGRCAVCGTEIRDTKSIRVRKDIPTYIRGVNPWQSVCKECLNGLNLLVDAFVKKRQERVRRVEELRRKFETLQSRGQSQDTIS